MRLSIPRLIVLCIVLMALSACGSKGPLVMPSDPPADAPKPAGQ